MLDANKMQIAQIVLPQVVRQFTRRTWLKASLSAGRGTGQRTVSNSPLPPDF